MRLGSLLIGEIAPRRASARRSRAHGRSRRPLPRRSPRRAIEAEPSIEIRREEVTTPDSGPGSERIWIIASGPLTPDAFAEEIARVTGSGRLFFYDSISPDHRRRVHRYVYRVSRVALRQIAGWHRRLSELSLRQGAIRCFPGRAAGGRGASPAHIAEDHPAPDNVRYFEACLPIEEIARRGRDTLRFIPPMKPAGPERSAHRPLLRGRGATAGEDARAGSYNLVGFRKSCASAINSACCA